MVEPTVHGVDLSRFVGVPYDIRRHTESVPVEEFIENPELGSNCQLLVVGMLKLCGFNIDTPNTVGRIGSKELWLYVGDEVLLVDRNDSSGYVDYFIRGKRAFDIFFFWPPGMQFTESIDDFKRLHVGIFLPVDCDKKVPILHNYKGGESGFWECEEFYRKDYKLFGVKRPIKGGENL